MIISLRLHLIGGLEREKEREKCEYTHNETASRRHPSLRLVDGHGMNGNFDTVAWTHLDDDDACRDRFLN